VVPDFLDCPPCGYMCYDYSRQWKDTKLLVEQVTHKEAYRLFWLVKGHIQISDQQAFDSANGYFKRLWEAGSNGAPLSEYEVGFEEEYYKKFPGLKKN